MPSMAPQALPASMQLRMSLSVTTLPESNSSPTLAEALFGHETIAKSSSSSRNMRDSAYVLR